MTAVRCAICFVILALMLAATSCSNVSRDVVSHQGFVGLRDFSVSSESTGLETYAKGTVYVRENAGKTNRYHVEILAWVEIDPSDWAGVGVYIPCGWEVTSITSNLEYPVDKISVWSSHFCDNPEYAQSRQWWQLVSVERSVSGTLVIELDSTSSEQNPWPGVLKVTVGVGSDERDGIRIQYPDRQEIEIPLSESTP